MYTYVYVKVMIVLLQGDSRAGTIIPPTRLCVELPSTMDSNLPPPMIGMSKDLFRLHLTHSTRYSNRDTSLNTQLWSFIIDL